MEKIKLIIEKNELEVLKELVKNSNYFNDNVLKQSVKELLEEFKDSQVLTQEEMPEDAVRLNSRVTVHLGNGWSNTFKIVHPKDSNIKQNLFSILSPMGFALYGHRKGDVFTWKFPAGPQTITVTEVENSEVVPQ